MKIYWVPHSPKFALFETTPETRMSDVTRHSLAL